MLDYFRPFCQLHKKAQADLLKRATPLYIQLMIAFYTATTLGSIKLREILQLLPHERVNNVMELHSLVGLFANQTGKLSPTS